MRAPLARATVAASWGGARRRRSRSRSASRRVIAAGRYRIVRLRRRGEEGQGEQRGQQLPQAVAGARGRRDPRRSARGSGGRRRCLRPGVRLPTPPGAARRPPPRRPRATPPRPPRPPRPRTTATRPPARPVGEVPPGGTPAADPVGGRHRGDAVRRPGRRGRGDRGGARRHPARPHGRGDGDPLAGVRVGVHDQPELGSTTTGGDGTFELAVNGGAQITLEYTRAGYLEVQRDVDPTQLDWTNPPDVVMLAADPVGVVLDPPGAAGWTTARATSQTRPRRHAHQHAAVRARARRRRCASPTAARSRCPGPWTVRQTEYTSVGPGRDARRPASHLRLHVRRRAGDRRGGRGRRGLGRPDARRAPTPTPPSTTSRTSSARRSAPTSRPAPTTAPTRCGSLHRTAAWSKVISETAGMAEPRHRRGRRQRRARTTRRPSKLTAAERTALAPLYAARGRAAPGPDPAPDARGTTTGRDGFPRARAAAARPGRKAAPRRLQAAGQLDDRLRGPAASARPSTSPARRTGCRTRRPGSRARPSRALDVPRDRVDAARRPDRRRARGRHRRPDGSPGATPIPRPSRTAPASRRSRRTSSTHVEWDGLDGLGEPVVGAVTRSSP